MMKVAVTGNVASGKTLLCRSWAREGVPLVHADELAREAVAPGTPGLAAVVEAFGEEILDQDGGLHRAALREVVFQDPRARKKLEEILHPLIRDLRNRWMKEQEAGGSLMAVAEIPLLFEVGLEGDFHVVVVVDAPREERLRRLLEARGLEEEEARRIMGTQMPAKEKLGRADYVVRNAGSPGELEARALALLDLLRARAGEGPGEAGT